MAPQKPPLPAEIGEIVGGYRLDSLIAQGGMGCVYAATHARLGRRAAVKVLVSSLAADELYVERFFNEARVVNAVRHPNIVDVFDFIESSHPRRVAYVMELIDGPPLSAILANRRLAVMQTVNIALQLVGVLDAVHQIDVVHRDLKPDNILVIAPVESDFSMVPCVKVLDFGIAKINDPSRATSTMPGAIMGTPAYMSPEQISGQAVTPAADVYALGAIIYEILAGRRLYPGEVMEVFRTKLMGQTAKLSLPHDLECRELVEELVIACTHADAIERPTLSEVRDRLLAIRGAIDDGLDPPTYPPRAQRGSTPIPPVRASSVPPVPLFPAARTPSAPSLTLSPPAPDTKTLVPTPTIDGWTPKKPPVLMIAGVAFLAIAALIVGVVAWRMNNNQPVVPATVILEAPIEQVNDPTPEPPKPEPTPEPQPVEIEQPEPAKPEPAKPEPAVKKKPIRKVDTPKPVKKKIPLRKDDMTPW